VSSDPADHSLPPGGGTDIFGRLIQPEELRTQIVIRHVGGATGTIGTSDVVRAKPDGRTLLLTSVAAISIQPSFLAKPPDQATQLATICLEAEAPATLMTQKETRLRKLDDVIAHAKAIPGQIAFASGGLGDLGHLLMTGFSRAAGSSLLHIPVRGSGDSVLAMQPGTVRMLTAEANLVAQYGLHAIVVFGAERARDVPDAPTLHELGYDLVFRLWTRIFVPVDPPMPVLALLDAACPKTLKTPSVVENMTKASHPIRYLDH
jgi:tripartite-type tricarboxylate transporter receptor subunit TctC